MTRIALLADIHGNLPALHAVLNDVRPFNPDGVRVTISRPDELDALLAAAPSFAG